jgi:hypothetical protein
MKTIFRYTFLLALPVVAMQSCTQPVDNAAAMKKIDSITMASLDQYRASLDSTCMADVMAQARLRADSLMTAAMKKGSSASKQKPPSKPSNQGTVSDRPGTQQDAPKTVTDRQGSINTSGPKTVTDRGGAQTPPKQ